MGFDGSAEIRPLKSSIARDFFIEHHYTKTCHNGVKAWGLVMDDELKGAIGFANPITEDIREAIFGDSFRGTVFGFHRLVTDDSCDKNVESWFVSKGIECFMADSPQYWALVTFADPTEGHSGTIYQATNAIYFGTTSALTYYKDEDGALHPYRDGNTTVTPEEAEERGWEPSERRPKHKYLYLLGKSKRHRKKLEDLLQVDPEPYPRAIDRDSGEVDVEGSWITGSATEASW